MLGGGVGLLVDTGSPGNLQGSEFRQMAEAEAIAAGRGPAVYTPLQTNLEVGGVGKRNADGNAQGDDPHRHRWGD